MAGTIYLVTNKLNGKQYVGQTVVAGNDIGHGTIMRKASDETRKKLSEAHKGRIVTEATRLKIAEGNRGKVVSDDTKAKIRAANIGKAPSEETKRKLSEAAKRQWAKQKGV